MGGAVSYVLGGGGGELSLITESLTPMPSLGVQLGTAKGLTVMNWEWKISHSKRFVPLSDVSTVVIHEGLVRWGVSYYLAVVGSSVTVAFEVGSRLQVPKLTERMSILHRMFWRKCIIARGRYYSTSTQTRMTREGTGVAGWEMTGTLVS